MVSAQYLRGARRGGDLLAGRLKILGEGEMKTYIRHWSLLSPVPTSAGYARRNWQQFPAKTKQEKLEAFLALSGLRSFANRMARGSPELSDSPFFTQY